MPDEPGLPDWVSAPASRPPVDVVDPGRTTGPALSGSRGHGRRRSVAVGGSATTFARRRLVAALAVTTVLALLLWALWPGGGSSVPARAT
ncbi:hypothetical protein, partial [Knoellia aerolata]|uniref:hypothetical protein n=1 Tax=Knoellia aerolata TaxID=442954 RepID=UPI001B80CD72